MSFAGLLLQPYLVVDDHDDDDHDDDDDDDDDDVQTAAPATITNYNDEATKAICFLSVLVVTMMVMAVPLTLTLSLPTTTGASSTKIDDENLAHAVVKALKNMTGDFDCFGAGRNFDCFGVATGDHVGGRCVWNRQSSSFRPHNDSTHLFTIPMVAFVVRDQGSYPMFTSGRLLQLAHDYQDLFIFGLEGQPAEKWTDVFSPPNVEYFSQLKIGLSEEGLSVDTNDAAPCDTKVKHPIIHYQTNRTVAAEETCHLFWAGGKVVDEKAGISKEDWMRQCRFMLCRGIDAHDYLQKFTSRVVDAIIASKQAHSPKGQTQSHSPKGQTQSDSTWFDSIWSGFKSVFVQSSVFDYFVPDWITSLLSWLDDLRKHIGDSLDFWVKIHIVLCLVCAFIGKENICLRMGTLAILVLLGIFSDILSFIGFTTEKSVLSRTLIEFLTFMFYFYVFVIR